MNTPTFEHIKNRYNISVWTVKNERKYMPTWLDDDDIIGSITWFPRGNTYIFIPKENVVYDLDCLNEISRFMDNLLYERKIGKIRR